MFHSGLSRLNEEAQIPGEVPVLVEEEVEVQQVEVHKQVRWEEPVDVALVLGDELVVMVLADEPVEVVLELVKVKKQDEDPFDSEALVEDELVVMVLADEPVEVVLGLVKVKKQEEAPFDGDALVEAVQEEVVLDHGVVEVADERLQATSGVNASRRPIRPQHERAAENACGWRWHLRRGANLP